MLSQCPTALLQLRNHEAPPCFHLMTFRRNCSREQCRSADLRAEMSQSLLCKLRTDGDILQGRGRHGSLLKPFWG